MAGYSRQSAASIVPTAVVRATPLNDEFNALRDSFVVATGHKHDGTSTEGAYVPVISDTNNRNKVVVDSANNRVGVFVNVSGSGVEQVRVVDGAVVPVTDNDVDLGSGSNEFKDLYIDGVANIDSLVADTVAISGGTANNMVIGNSTPEAITGTTITANTGFSGPLIGTPTAPTAAAGTNTTQIATTAFVNAERTNTATLQNKTFNLANNTFVATSAQLLAAVTDESGTGSLLFSNSPALTGTPTAPTAGAGTNTTQIATTEFVQSTAFSSALPSQTGNTGKYVTTNGTTASWVPLFTSNFQEFTSSGTWTKPTGATFVMVELWGGGGGGGSGRRGATSTVRGGGGGGGGGAYAYRLFRASDLASTESVTIGAGGSGSSARTTNDTDGDQGSNGGNTVFSGLILVGGGRGGRSGLAGSQSASTGGGVLGADDPISGSGGGIIFTGHFGGGSDASNNFLPVPSGFGGGGGGGVTSDGVNQQGASSYQGGPGGGAGGGISAINTVYAGSSGGGITGRLGSGAGGGASGGSAGSNGSGRSGGGGGGANASGAGGNGGTGGSFGSGGGGGGASLNGNNSGAGGAGGNGLVRIYTW